MVKSTDGDNEGEGDNLDAAVVNVTTLSAFHQNAISDLLLFKAPAEEDS